MGDKHAWKGSASERGLNPDGYGQLFFMLSPTMESRFFQAFADMLISLPLSP